MIDPARAFEGTKEQWALLGLVLLSAVVIYKCLRDAWGK